MPGSRETGRVHGRSPGRSATHGAFHDDHLDRAFRPRAEFGPVQDACRRSMIGAGWQSAQIAYPAPNGRLAAHSTAVARTMLIPSSHPCGAGQTQPHAHTPCTATTTSPTKKCMVLFRRRQAFSFVAPAAPVCAPSAISRCRSSAESPLYETTTDPPCRPRCVFCGAGSTACAKRRAGTMHRPTGSGG